MAGEINIDLPASAVKNWGSNTGVVIYLGLLTTGVIIGSAILIAQKKDQNFRMSQNQ